MRAGPRVSRVSILNDVLGPVMRGPSSSHTAGSYHIAKIVTGLLGAPPVAAGFAFDPAGSYAQVYWQQGVDRAFATALMGWELTDDRFAASLDLAAEAGLEIRFDVRPLAKPDHPNTVEIALRAADGRTLAATARSIGGGAVEVVEVEGWAVHLTGYTWEALVETTAAHADRIVSALSADGQLAAGADRRERGGRVLVDVRRLAPLEAAARAALEDLGAAATLREAPPIAFVKRGRQLFQSGAEMLALAGAHGWSLGRAALAYEAELLGLSEAAVIDEVSRRFDIMQAAVHLGLDPAAPSMQLLAPSARAIVDADAAGRLPLGGLHTRAAARAMAVMHVNGAMGVVCAAPTGGSAGAVPGVVVTLAEERALPRAGAAMALLAASAIGVILAERATFAAEVAGCQVEIGAAGAMGAAAVVEAAGGSAAHAADAAAIAFQNSMGSVCDLVGGMVEIPCHTRNAVAASSAFVCADLVVGGYVNPIPLDETIDAVYAVGRMMPTELLCTSKGGLAVTPSALRLVARRR
ncbi:MAG: L-serine ammonia-lyase, iron-sulfur-dependent, subunit alpha [Vicinamibacterales bacterium]|jgi:L-serine dehydratase|nr:L-serine ammonia-lyase, iron-sulfur-dependent, subunit alpha [Vicinamibacterales bacterium]